MERLTKASVFKLFDELQDSIDTHSEGRPDDDGDAFQYREEFENHYYATISTAKTLLVRGAPKPTVNYMQPAINQADFVTIRTDPLADQVEIIYCISIIANQNNAIDVQCEEGTNNPVNFNNVRLPKIDIRKFDGEISDWLAFRDTFDSLIHRNGTITNIQKFNYVKSVLLGPPGALRNCWNYPP